MSLLKSLNAIHIIIIHEKNILRSLIILYFYNILIIFIKMLLYDRFYNKNK